MVDNQNNSYVQKKCGRGMQLPIHSMAVKVALLVARVAFCQWTISEVNEARI